MAPTVRHLISALSSDYVETRAQAAERLAALATAEEARSELIAAGASRPLIALLGTGSPEARTHAASCLMHLASSDARREVILAAGAVASLWDLVLAPEEPENRQEALGALCNLAVAEKAQMAMLSINAVPHLVALLPAGTARSQVRVLGILAALARRSEWREEIVAAGALSPLVAFLSERDQEERVLAAARVIATLAASNAMRVAAAKQGVIPPLAALLKNGSSEEQAAAAGALAALAAEDEYVVEQGKPDPALPVMADKFLDAGVLPLLVALLTKGNPEGRGLAISALAVLMDKLDLQGPLIDAGGLTPLISMIRSTEGDPAKSRATAAETLRLLATTSEENREAIKAAVPRNRRGRDELLRTLNLYCL